MIYLLRDVLQFRQRCLRGSCVGDAAERVTKISNAVCNLFANVDPAHHKTLRNGRALLSDLLSYAHASSISDEAVQPVPAFVPLNEALESLAGAIRESGAQIAIGEMPAVNMRESHLSQVFQNLIGNAIKYRSETERLRIEVMARRGEASHWILSVTDNGIGVPRAYQEAIFGIFKRLHPSSKYSGTFNGKKELVERLLTPLAAQVEGGMTVTPLNLIADGDYVVMQAQGKALSKNGERYDNTYCHVFKIAGGKVKEVTEYLDTELITRAFGK